MATRKVLPLNDRQKWAFRQADCPDSEWMEVCDMPTNVHLDLLQNGAISNPLIGKRENDCQWVGEKSWVYRGTFATPTVRSGEKAVLTFKGLDTYARVVLNGNEILKTQDMFIPERVIVTNMLCSEGENMLEIAFGSAYLIGKNLVEQHPNHRWGCWNGDSSRLAVRKAQYHYVVSSFYSLQTPLLTAILGLGLGAVLAHLRSMAANKSRDLSFTYLRSVFHDRSC